MELLSGRTPLIGVIHLPALPGAPRFGGSFSAILESARRDGEILAAAGFDAVIVENFGDAPFFRGSVPPETVASMTVCCELVRRTSGLPLGVNVLRNDGHAALAIASATGAQFIRVNILVGARVTDQGVIETDAARLLRTRRALGLDRVGLIADVDVKHSSALGGTSIDDEALEAVERGLADAIVGSGARTGEEASREGILAVKHATKAPVWVGSGVRADTLVEWLGVANGIIVGSDLRANGRAGGPIDRARAEAFVRARSG